MAEQARSLANGATRIDFQTDPSRYRHWKLAVDGEVATLTMDVDENAGLFEGYQLFKAADTAPAFLKGAASTANNALSVCCERRPFHRRHRH